ncbi:unnamed protein product [Arabis nemorensis]|uniref:MATH domain-containing protein n=1 Tax=Arabis nemorensis TaxID=586526 RepID=A0A565CHV1_9BRAS|nr:unnamed protein product [Arabis nemorensis]
MGNQLVTQSNTTTVSANGFIVEATHVELANWIFKSYPETTVHVQLQNQELRTTYMNVLFMTIKTLYHKKNLSESELSKASKDLSDLTQAGFKLDWLRSKLDKVSLEMKKRNDSEARIVELEHKYNKLELMMSDLKVELREKKAKFK